mmetsp:Transcript_1101/g.2027  ORF Transcript_1101/g.2027 Transcript_1101/m.2027 type:complete len:98 (-) Transcript_1101:1051-1344(-)
MVICNRDFSCGGCMDVDNQNTKLNTSTNAPLDANGQLTQPIKKEMQQFVKSMKTNQQWQNQDNNTFGTTDSNNQFRSSYRSSGNPYGLQGQKTDVKA